MKGDIREINILSQMKHPSIVEMKGVSFQNFAKESHITIIMEYMKHGSLQQILEKERKGQVSFEYNNTNRQIIITGIANGMKYLHSHNIIHRDLKPGNILIDSKFHPKITDFGTSKFFDQNHQHSQTQTYGTLFYMSPESQLDGDNGIESDVYSFGIILFEILTAHPAYDLTSPELKTTLKLQNKVCLDNYRPQFPFPIKAEFQELIEQCWDPIPYNRPKFTEIYEKLSSDKKYLLNDVDEEEFLVYLDELEEAKNNDFQIQNEEIIAELLAENQILRNENELLKNQTNEEK